SQEVSLASVAEPQRVRRRAPYRQSRKSFPNEAADLFARVRAERRRRGDYRDVASARPGGSARTAGRAEIRCHGGDKHAGGRFRRTRISVFHTSAARNSWTLEVGPKLRCHSCCRACVGAFASRVVGAETSGDRTSRLPSNLSERVVGAPARRENLSWILSVRALWRVPALFEVGEARRKLSAFAGDVSAKLVGSPRRTKYRDLASRNGAARAAEVSGYLLRD